MLFNNKIPLIILLIISGLIIVLYAMTSTIVMNGFSGVEEQDTRQNVERVINALSDDQFVLNKTVNDWSLWDEIYSFTLNRNDKFLTSFLYDDEFRLLDVNLIMIVNSSGQIFFVKAMDIETMQKMTFLNSSLQKLVIRDGGKEQSFSGIINLREGSMMIAGRPILTNNGSGPSPGTLIMGRFVDSKEINRLAKTTRLAISASAYEDQKMSADFEAKLPLFKKGTDTIIVPLNEDIIAGYTIIRDIYGKPVLLLRVDMPRFIYMQGKESLNYYLVSLLVVGLVFGIVAGSLLKKLKLWELKTKESEEQYRTLIETSPDGIVLLDVNSKIIMANQMTAELYGYGRLEEIVGKNISDMIIPEDRQSVKEILHRVPKTGSTHCIEFTALKKGDQTFSAEVRLSLILDAERKPKAMVVVIRDITKRKIAEENVKKSLQEKEVLLREIHHRVKNNMQIVASLLNLQSQNFEDKKYKDIFIDSQSRIYAMALVHEKLYQSESLAKIDIKEYIDGVVSNIFESYGQKSNVKFDINIENILINIDYAVPCGLIINEILTNSFKYAFPDERQGTIKISIKSNDNNMIQISISDNGIGILKDLDIRNTKSLGLKLITGLAEGQLHGEIILNRDNGTEFIINFRQGEVIT